MLDVIVDAAGQKGTGRWTVIEAQHLAAAIPAIDAAVVARNLSAQRDNRAQGETLFGAAPQPVTDITVDDLEKALMHCAALWRLPHWAVWRCLHCRQAWHISMRCAQRAARPI